MLYKAQNKKIKPCRHWQNIQESWHLYFVPTILKNFQGIRTKIINGIRTQPFVLVHFRVNALGKYMNPSFTTAIDEDLDKASSLNMVRQSVYVKENAEIKPVLLYLKSARLSYPGGKSNCFWWKQRSIIKCLVAKKCKSCDIYRSVWYMYEEVRFNK